MAGFVPVRSETKAVTRWGGVSTDRILRQTPGRTHVTVELSCNVEPHNTHDDTGKSQESCSDVNEKRPSPLPSAGIHLPLKVERGNVFPYVKPCKRMQDLQEMTLANNLRSALMRGKSGVGTNRKSPLRTRRHQWTSLTSTLGMGGLRGRETKWHCTRCFEDASKHEERTMCPSPCECHLALTVYRNRRKSR